MIADFLSFKPSLSLWSFLSLQHCRQSPITTITTSMMSIAQESGNSHITSLIVKNLMPDVTEAMLLEKFSQIGPVLSVRVCWDWGSECSLRLAIVNFQQRADAKRALEVLNYAPINGLPCRIMWTECYASPRCSTNSHIVHGTPAFGTPGFGTPK